MTCSSATTGPWHYYARGDGFIIRSKSAQGPIAGVNGNRPIEDAEANARLIAEAGTVLHETGLSPRELLSIIDGMVLVCGRTGDAFYDFEEQAAAFQAETGWMRPGKSMPLEMSRGGDDDHEARRIKYNAWVQSKIELARSALAQREPQPGRKSEGK